MSRAPFDELAQLALIGEQESRAIDARNRHAARRARLVDSGIRRVILPRFAEWIAREKYGDGALLDTHAMQLVRTFENTHNAGLYDANILVMSGDLGVGKTISVGCLIALPERTYKGKHLSDTRIYRTAEQLRVAYVARGHEWQRICGARVAVIDEFGTEGREKTEPGEKTVPHPLSLSDPSLKPVSIASPSAQRALQTFITQRAGDEWLLSVLVSNVDNAAFRVRYEPRTISKIDERAKWVVATGENLRVPLEQRADHHEALARATGRRP